MNIIPTETTTQLCLDKFKAGETVFKFGRTKMKQNKSN